MFSVNLENMEIKMHAGDTGSFKVHAERESGTAWTENDRMMFTVKDGAGEIVLQRIYRMDDQWDLGDGVVLIEFHNDDTDQWESGQYATELRFNISPIWEGTPPTARCVDALRESAKMVEGAIVRTMVQSTLTISNVYGDI